MVAIRQKLNEIRQGGDKVLRLLKLGGRISPVKLAIYVGDILSALSEIGSLLYELEAIADEDPRLSED